MDYKLLICSDTHETAPGIIAPPDARCWLHAGDYYLNKDTASTDDESDAQYADTIGELEGVTPINGLSSARCPFIPSGATMMAMMPGVSFAPSMTLQAKLPASGRDYWLRASGGMAGITTICHRMGVLLTPVQLSPAPVRSLRKPGDGLILLTHYPAYAPPVAKNKAGTFAILRKLAEGLNPLLVIQGHVHEWAGSHYDVLLDSKRVLVANPGGFGMVVSIDPAKRAVSIAGRLGSRAGR